MKRKPRVCGECSHFRPDEPYGLGGFVSFTIWRTCVAKKCGVRADTTAAERCEHFKKRRKKR